VIALFMVIGRGVMGLGCVLVMFGCLAVCFVCHKDPRFPGYGVPPIAIAIEEMP
jgi:hypothetical protein